MNPNKEFERIREFLTRGEADYIDDRIEDLAKFRELQMVQMQLDRKEGQR